MTIETNDDLVAAGYRTWGDVDPFEDLIGPFYLKDNGDGTHRSAFVAEAERHCNAGGMLHGGLLMSFADFALFAIAKEALGGFGVTVAFNSEFVSAGQAGELVEATGEITRDTRSLIFVRGKIFSGDRTIMAFSGIIKKVKGRGEHKG
ncbi:MULTISPECIES: PaaI family thioesterase [Kordiimonas]|jgi:acyl-coenzyme A thioesterase PaaI-like protein|uniref:PaaI family thioesterase n=1 Tax=Kordiimonas TaxID=288021 RepID=UPI00257F3572|nr:PaaI family thioesterase [Kordiimonas sp. UBA4487]